MNNLGKFAAVVIIVSTTSFGISSCTRGDVNNPANPTGGASGTQQQMQTEMGNRTTPMSNQTQKQGMQSTPQTRETQQTKTSGGAAGTQNQKACPVAKKKQTQ